MNPYKLAEKLGRTKSSLDNKKHQLKNQAKIERKKRELKAKSSQKDIEKEKREQKAYEKLISKPVNAGLRLSDVKVKIGQVYVVENNNSRTKNKNYFKGEVIQITNRHVTLKNSRNLRETFLKTDILMKEYEFKEVV